MFLNSIITLYKGIEYTTDFCSSVSKNKMSRVVLVKAPMITFLTQMEYKIIPKHTYIQYTPLHLKIAYKLRYTVLKGELGQGLV